MRKYFTRKRIILAVLVLLGGGGAAYAFLRGPEAPTYETITLQKTTVRQEVSVTGRVKAAEEVDLAFERSGRVVAVPVKVGDRVEANTVVLKLDASELAADLRRSTASVQSAVASRSQAAAAVASAEAKLAEVRRGTRSEELLISETKLANAKRALTDARGDLASTVAKGEADVQKLYEAIPNIVTDAYLTTEEAVLTQVADLFTGITAPRLSFVTSDTQAQLDAENKRRDMDTMLVRFRALKDSLPSTRAGRDASLTEAIGYVRQAQSFLESVSLTLNVSTSLSSTTVATYKGYVNTARSAVSAEVSALTTQQKTINSQLATNQVSSSAAELRVNEAERAVELAENELALKRAGSTTEQVQTQEAEVDRARANLAVAEAAVAEAEAGRSNIQAQIEKTELRAPFAGIVTRIDVKLGETLQPTMAPVSLISEDLFQIEADVPEADIAKITMNLTARTTLDAYGSDVDFPATVVKIDPAERLIDGVATYRVTLQFMQKDDRIRSGMTANVDIQGEERTDVLAVPLRAVIVDGSTRIVRVLRNGEPADVTVTLGLRGTDGTVEVMSGLSVGDVVILFSQSDE